MDKKHVIIMACVSVILTAVFTFVASGILSPKKTNAQSSAEAEEENFSFRLPPHYACEDNGVVCVRAGKIEIDLSYRVEARKTAQEITVFKRYETLRSNFPLLNFRDETKEVYPNDGAETYAPLSYPLESSAVKILYADQIRTEAKLNANALLGGARELRDLIGTKMKKDAAVTPIGGSLSATYENGFLKSAGIEERYRADVDFLNLKNVGIAFFRNVSVRSL